MEAGNSNDDELRQQAVKSLHAKRDFKSHLVTFVGVSILLIVIWALTGAGDFFWPIFPILGWGVFGVIPHWWSVYKTKGITEDQIQEEMRKIGGPGGPGA